MITKDISKKKYHHRDKYEDSNNKKHSLSQKHNKVLSRRDLRHCF